MSRSQAVRSGFSQVFKQPSLVFAELAWRWAFDVAAWMLIIYSLLLFLHSIPVSNSDLFGLSGIIPGAYKTALAHIFHGSGPKMARLVLALGFGLAFLWWVAASLGRAATLSAMLPDAAGRIATVYRLFGLRVIIAAIGFLAYIGAFLLASSYSSLGEGKHDFPRLYLFFVPAAIIVGTIWSSLNWYLQLAAIVSAHNNTGALRSFYDAAMLSRRQAAQFFWVNFVFGLLRLVLVAAAFSSFFSALGTLAQAPPEFGLTACILILVGYSALANWMNVIRIAALVRIVEWDATYVAIPSHSHSQTRSPIAPTPAVRTT